MRKDKVLSAQQNCTGKQYIVLDFKGKISQAVPNEGGVRFGMANVSDKRSSDCWVSYMEVFF
jgi:hypothetical protein